MKSILFLLPMILCSSLGFAQYTKTSTGFKVRTYDQGYPMQESQMAGSYNAPARIDVRSSWDIFFSGTFTYWQAREEGLELAFSKSVPAGIGVRPFQGEQINMRFLYKPGFKVAAGLFSNYDDWGFMAEYTWFRSRTAHSSGSPPNGSLVPRWFEFANAFLGFCTGVSSTWKLRMDLIDFAATRSCYVGKSLIFRPYFGGKGGWINQKYNLTGNFFRTPLGNTPHISVANRNKSRSWLLGPRVGIDTLWMLGSGFRILGTVAGSLLYTRYKVSLREEALTPSLTFAFDMKNTIAYLRPNIDLRFGSGWGTYFGRTSWHMDIEASFDYQIYWNQNMMRKLSDSKEFRSDGNIGDLYLLGLTATVRFDF